MTADSVEFPNPGIDVAHLVENRPMLTHWHGRTVLATQGADETGPLFSFGNESEGPLTEETLVSGFMALMNQHDPAGNPLAVQPYATVSSLLNARRIDALLTEIGEEPFSINGRILLIMGDVRVPDDVVFIVASPQQVPFGLDFRGAHRIRLT